MPEMLTDRQLNRATLARQMLLERSDRRIVEAVEFLLGQQAQQTHDPYIGLWSRLHGFEHGALTGLIVGRQLARATTMRGTLHLHSPADLFGIRRLVRPVLERMWQSNFSRRFGNNDPAEVLAAAIEVADRGPATASSIGKALKDRFPTAEPLAMTVLLQVREIMVQVPPTRIWGSGHAPLLQRAPTYLQPMQSELDLTTLVRRYLAAYGPASVHDMQSWCGLTKLGEVFDAIRGELVTFTASDSRELFDLPDAPRPDADTPAPIRFMPLYDNAFLGYDNRRRMLDPRDENGGDFLRDAKPTVLVDGVITATWTIERRKATAMLTVTPKWTLRKADIAAIEHEAERLIRFMEETAETFEVRVSEPRE